MDVQQHILEAGSVDSPLQSPRHMKSLVSLADRSRVDLRSPRRPTSASSAESMSSISDLGPDHHYLTELTTPASSSLSTEYEDAMVPDEVESFRDREFPQLKGKTYLDNGGTTLYAKSLIEEISRDLISNLYGNPHSASTPSALAGHRIDTIREKILRFFNANPDDYDLIFTANATAAIKLVLECVRDHAAASNTPVWYGFHKDSHTSVVGGRELTKLTRCFTSDEEVDIWINSGGLGGPRARQLGLFAYPGQSNMTGRRLPLNWPGRIRKSFHKAPTYTLLDAAALASTAPVDLSDVTTAPDFTTVSFYKIFGYPDIGALIVRKESIPVLDSRRYFGGGTVDIVIALGESWHTRKQDAIYQRLEDGTLPFHSIFAIDHAINVHERLYGPNPMKFISMHTAQLGKQLYDGLCALKHSNGLPMTEVYKDPGTVYGDPSLQGATCAFNVMLSDGQVTGYEDVEQAADDKNIYLRSGSLCNPGGMAHYLGWSASEIRAAHAAGHRCSVPIQVIHNRATGVIRASLGPMNIAQDVTNLLDFLRDSYRDQTTASLALRAEPQSAQSANGHACKAPPASGTHSGNTTIRPMSAGAGKEVVVVADKISPAPAESSIVKTEAPKLSSPPPPMPVTLPDYSKIRKPWEEEMRKSHYPNVGMEIKVKEMEDNSVFSKAHTPSVRARKFGRSVVNLLRTKSQVPDSRYMSPRLPMEFGSNKSHHSSRKSEEKAQFAENCRGLLI